MNKDLTFFIGMSTSRIYVKIKHSYLHTLPIGENDFKVLWIWNQAIVWDDAEIGATYGVEYPTDMIDEVKEYRSILIEAVADYDETAWKYMENQILLQKKKSTLL
jgi:translation elongation factor EF-G